ncbi:hypothetical protein ACFV2X_43180 [Streptomyces sp. NPDC059679]|uniref:hypothetical protein n=1 Tax=Streptomyces sp. NPDC059679 TaxID=3346903 RepID=UPI00367E934B
MSTPEHSSPSWAEQSAHADLIRTTTAAEARKAELDAQLAEARNAPKIAAAEAEAARIKREAAKTREEEEVREAEEAAAKKRAEQSAATWRNWARAFMIACVVVSLPLQVLAFWDPDAWFLVITPFVLEGGAYALLKGAAAAIDENRPSWHYRTGAFLNALFAAYINFSHGSEVYGTATAVAGAFCSVAGPAMWDLHEHGRISKRHGKTPRALRKAAEAEARKAEAELAAKRAEIEGRRQLEADRRKTAEARAAEAKMAEEQAIANQDKRRSELFPSAWERYEQIITAHPLGGISRDRAWTDARRAAAFLDVWDRYEMLLAASPANIRATDLWAAAWRSVHGLPIGQTAETLAAELAARAAVDEVMQSAGRTPEATAVELLLADVFDEDEGGGNGGGNAPNGRGPGGPSQGPTTLGRKGKQGSGRNSGKTPERPLTEADLEKVRKLADALGGADKLSARNVREVLGGGANEYAVRARKAVQRERGVKE